MRRREIYFLAAAVMIGFCRVLRGENFFLASMKVMLELWEDTINNK